MFSTLNAFEFQKQFHDTNSCLKYLVENPAGLTPIRHVSLCLKSSGEEGSVFVDFPDNVNIDNPTRQ